MTLAILADDLTGACDAAAPFARRGLRTVVVLDLAYPDTSGTSSEGPGAIGRPAVLAVDADNRRLGRRLAGSRTGLAARALREGGATFLYKKIDSTLRGHVAAELAATLRAWDAPLAVICPAFPAVGRWVQGGHLFVDKRGDLGDVAELAGLTGSAGSGTARTALGRRLARLGLDVVGHGADAVAEALERARRDGAQIVVADANTPGHLTALAAAATRLEPAALLVGSAGLAAALAELQ
ncbi:MAG: four-carbon acid sugar kinase family protein, partial [Chloroflexota bacterium]|nr:four-carbon acid sugar kinase family protein [Chloroflexota bacterium]